MGDDLARRVDSLEWYHTIDLGHGVVTPGEYDHRPYLHHYALPTDLSGQTALDVGTSSGFFAFELARRGAQVTAIDLPAWSAHDFGPRYRSPRTDEEAQRYMRQPFELARHALGLPVERREMSVYDLSPQTVGKFDLVFCGSLLLHLTDPLRALWRIRSVTAGLAIIATALAPPLYEDDAPLALFAGHLDGDTWWLPNRAALEAMVQSAGFARWRFVSQFRLDRRDGQAGMRHGVIHAWSEPGPETPAPPPPPEREAGESLIQLRARLAEQEATIARLQEQVAGYERGRFVRLMRWLKRRRAGRDDG